MENDRNNTGMIGNFGIGLILGLVAGLLIAPRKGEETRENIKQAAGAAMEKIRTEPARVKE